MIKIAVLQTGHNNPALPSHLRSYPQMFDDLLLSQEGSAQIELHHFAVVDGVFPETVTGFDGYLITGSRHGVYDDLPFIAPLMQFIRDAFALGIPQVGICFGHQAIAQALGGKVVKSPKGWGVGIRTVNVVETLDWMAGSSDRLDLLYVHQDQVIELPEGATNLAGDEFCPHAAFAMGDKVFTFQGHPEFDKDYVHELLAIRGQDMGQEVAETASRSLSLSHDGAQVGQWLVSFFLTNCRPKDD